MQIIRRAADRGKVDLGWLTSWHSFSFGHYYDPNHMGVSVLRVINDDSIMPSRGFDTHGHRDMEIITYVTQGTLEHRDSEGNHYLVPAGEVQRMSAGKGVQHSEYNHSSKERAELLQIWIEPKSKGIDPSYQQKAVPQQGKLTPIVTPDGRDNSVSMHQDASISRLVLAAGESHQLPLEYGVGYLHLIQGNLKLADANLAVGDGVRIDSTSGAEISAVESTEALWFDLPKG
jgi:redox-sensitive bicupin YhaK (pirin superfamily)